MKFTSQQYAQALYDAIYQTKDSDHGLVLDNFVKILAQNNDLHKHAEIEKEFKILKMKAKGISQAQVTVAREVEINKGIIDDLNAVLRRPSSQEKTAFSISAKIDKSIIGGVVVRVDDTLIDASVKTQLNNLNENLKQ